MNRSEVIIDGSNGTVKQPCPSTPGLQNFAPRDGLVVWKASGVSIENLTVCNYLAGPRAMHGTEIWWTGGDSTESSEPYGPNRHSSSSRARGLRLSRFKGSYLTATSAYGPASPDSHHLAEFGIFADHASGPGVITDSYASNMGNAAFYVGGCQRSCNTTLSRDHGTNSAVGFLGTNSGGQLIVESSLFDHNRTGLVLLSLNTDDLPPPQDGRCPESSSDSCTVIVHNRIADNNAASAPAFGIKPAIGVGVEISGGKFDTVTGNAIARNGSWGVLINDSLDGLSHDARSHCEGGTPNVAGENTCLFVALGNRVFSNIFLRNGTFGNPTNGDLAALSLLPMRPSPRNCFYSNRAIDAPIKSSPPEIQATSVDGEPCTAAGTALNEALLKQLPCADGGSCGLKSAHYPRAELIDAINLPRLATMPRPCAGIPRNGFC